MPIVRVVHNRNYLMVLNSTVLDQRLPLATRGFLLCLLTLPDDWRFNLRDLSKRLHIGKDTASRYLLALQRTGYCQVSKTRESGGRFRAEYVVHEAPVLKSRTGSLSPKAGPAKLDVLDNLGTKYRGGDTTQRDRLETAKLDSDLPSSLRSALEQLARTAGVGSRFMTPEWWHAVRDLYCRDGVGAAAIQETFKICLATDLQNVRFFPDRFPKYVALQKRPAASKVIDFQGRQGDHSGERSAEPLGHEKDVSQKERRQILAEHAARGNKFAADLLRYQNVPRRTSS